MLFPLQAGGSESLGASFTVRSFILFSRSRTLDSLISADSVSSMFDLYASRWSNRCYVVKWKVRLEVDGSQCFSKMSAAHCCLSSEYLKIANEIPKIWCLFEPSFIFALTETSNNVSRVRALSDRVHDIWTFIFKIYLDIYTIWHEVILSVHGPGRNVGNMHQTGEWRFMEAVERQQLLAHWQTKSLAKHGANVRMQWNTGFFRNFAVYAKYACACYVAVFTFLMFPFCVKGETGLHREQYSFTCIQ